jgi:Flp pilus assembly protein TadG
MTKHPGNQRGTRRGERGAILLQVLIGSVVLIGLSMYVVDYGMMWVARRQAQNAADGAALAGAIAMAFDGADRTWNSVAKADARNVALAHVVIGEAPDVNPLSNNPADMDVLFYNDDTTKFPAVCADDSCIRVDVYRNQERANPLPTWFGGLVGLSTQGVRATATARSMPANGTQCLKPWAVADKWVEGPTLDSDGDGFVYTQSATFNPADGDYYIPPTAEDAGTGFSNKDANGDPLDWGYQMTLKLANPGGGNGNGPFVMSSGWAMRLDMPNAGNPDYEANISGCTSAAIGIAAPGFNCPDNGSQSGWEYYEEGCIPVEPGSGVGQDRNGLEGHGQDDGLLDEDTGAPDYWDRTCNSNRGCIVSDQQISKRIVPVAIFDTAAYMAGVASNAFNGSNGVIKVVNIVGFFIEGTCNDNSFVHESYLQCSENGNERDIIGRLVSYPAIHIQGAAEIGNAAFGQVIQLIR